MVFFFFFFPQANENQENSQKLLSENKNMLIELNGQLNSAETLLQQGHLQQQQADELLAVSYTHLTLPTIYSV